MTSSSAFSSVPNTTRPSTPERRSQSVDMTTLKASWSVAPASLRRERGRDRGAARRHRQDKMDVGASLTPNFAQHCATLLGNSDASIASTPNDEPTDDDWVEYGTNMPIGVPSRPLEGLTMDFVTDLPESMASGCTGMAVIVDRFTKCTIHLPIVRI